MTAACNKRIKSNRDTFVYNFFFPVYSALWRLASPLLRHSPRLAEGWRQRTLQAAPQGPFDLWIQSASGGEAIIANMVLGYLAQMRKEGKIARQLRILATATTPQGINILKEGAPQNSAETELVISYFPLDAPALMAKAFRLFSPRLAILVETELWPGFLASARQNGVMVMVINGRMSAKSHSAYRKISSFFRDIGPQKVLAMSVEDGRRFADIVGGEKVTTIPNLKFDTFTQAAVTQESVKNILPGNTPFVVFGSIRKPEETEIINCIHQLHSRHPTLITGLFPKHIERARNMLQRIAMLGIPCTLRSSLATEPAPAGSVIVWDLFGELAAAYQQAEAAFVGGSLYPEGGGHNLIEPLVAGIRPVTGIHWQDFAWLGQEVVELGLVEEVNNGRELTAALLARLEHGENRESNTGKAEQYLAAKRGGTATTCGEIIKLLQENTQ